MRKEFRSLISLEEALSIVQSRLPLTSVETVPLPLAQGRILAEKIVSSLDVPGFARASMDGFAVQAEDTLEAREDRPVCLRLAGSVPMGALPHVRVAQGEAAEVAIKGQARPGNCAPNCARGRGMVALVLADHLLRHRAARMQI